MVKPRILAYPYGRCMSISLPSQKNSSYTKLNSLYLSLNNDHPILGNKSLRIFFMDQVNSLQLYPDEMEMTGDPLKVKIDSHPGKHRTKPKSQDFNKSKVTRVLNAVSTLKKIHTVAAFKMNCLSSLTKKLVASLLFCSKIRPASATKSSMTPPIPPEPKG